MGLLISYVANVANVTKVRPSKSPLKGDSDPPRPSPKGRELFSPFKGGGDRGGLGLEGLVSLRISDHKITIRDTVFITRTDTLLRTQTITQTERYIHSFDRFCTITLATLATFATLAFSIHFRS